MKNAVKDLFSMGAAVKGKRIAEEKAENKAKEKQLQIPLFAYVFLAVFFGFFIALELSFGRPLTPPSFIAPRSASVYTPADPIYLKGFLSARCSLLFTATDDIFKAKAISWTVSKTVFSSIYNSLHHFLYTNQWENCKKSGLLDNLLHVCKVKNQKKCKFSKIFDTTIDNPLRQRYILYISVLTIRHLLNKRQSEAPIAEWHSTEAKGELYEREGFIESYNYHGIGSGFRAEGNERIECYSRRFKSKIPYDMSQEFKTLSLLIIT
jgi:hypothetical protein